MGKKGKDKLSKMSEEERARYLQLRADIEEEARRRKIQLLSIYMKNKLKREDAFCRLNMAKINQEWRSILRQVKCQELHNEIVEVEIFFKNQIDHKGQIIERLLNALDLAEDMYSTLQQSHIEMLNQLIEFQKQRINYFKEIYTNEKRIVLQECQNDFAYYMCLHNHAQDNLECVKFHLEDRTAQTLNEHHERYLQRLDDIHSAIQLRLEESTFRGEVKLEVLWQEYQNMMGNYLRHTENFYAEYVDLKISDEDNTISIHSHCCEIEKATDHLANLKLTALNAEEKNEIQESYLEKIRNGLKQRLTECKKRFSKTIRKDRKRFKLLSVKSHHALNILENFVRKGETLMQIAKVCRKYETGHEQLMLIPLIPFDSSTLTKQITPKTNICQWNEMTDINKANCWNSWKQMENFWTRVNNAITDVFYLSRQKRILDEENIQLKCKLKEYLITLNLSNGSNLYITHRPHSMRMDRGGQIESANKKSHSANKRHYKYYSSVPILTHTASYVEANLANTIRSSRFKKGNYNLPQLIK